MPHHWLLMENRAVTRYLVERTFPDQLGSMQRIPVPTAKAVVAVNGQEQVTWLHSYVTRTRKRPSVISDGPSRRRPCSCKITPSANKPASQPGSTEVRVLDPYFNY